MCHFFLHSEVKPKPITLVTRNTLHLDWSIGMSVSLRLARVIISGAPDAKGRQAEPHTHRKVNETHELIFSWLSRLVVLLTGAYANDNDDGGVLQHGGLLQLIIG